MSEQLEDLIYSEEVKCVEQEYIYQQIYRLKDHVFQNQVKEELSLGEKMSQTAAEKRVVASMFWRDYIEGMVEAQRDYKLTKAKVEKLRMIYFKQQAERKAGQKAYNYWDAAQNSDSEYKAVPEGI